MRRQFLARYTAVYLVSEDEYELAKIKTRLEQLKQSKLLIPTPWLLKVDEFGYDFFVADLTDCRATLIETAKLE